MSRARIVAAALACALPVALPPGAYLSAQVTVVRELPQSGAKRGTARWREPLPEAEASRETGEADLSGRLSVGGRGGEDPDGNRLYDVTTDSYVTVVQPLGREGSLTVDANALRSRSATDRDQTYTGSLELEFERASFDVSGGYGESLAPVEGTQKQDTDAYAGASFFSGHLETLPMQLTYQSTWADREQDDVRTESGRSDDASFEAVGTAGAVGLEVGATVSYEQDYLEEDESLGTGGSLRVRVPAGEQLSVQAIAIPNFNRSESESAQLTSRSLESGAGLIWSVAEDLQTDLLVSRVDTWAEGSGVTYEPYQATWKGETALQYEPSEGLFAGPSYGLAKTRGGKLSQEVELVAGWRAKDAAVRELSGEGGAGLIRSDSGARVKDDLEWGTTVSLVPVQEMNVSNSYVGGYVWEDGSESWEHKGEVSYQHAPGRLVEYRAAASVSGTLDDETEELWKQQYQAGVTLKPRRRFKVFVVDVSESVSLTDGPKGEDFLSSAALVTAIPITEGVGSRLGAQWDWINRTAPGKGPGNNYRYSAALSLAAETFPFSFDTEYAFSHGYRGIRHDLDSALQVPFESGFALEGVFTLNSYEKEGEATLPFLLGLNLVYEFS